MSTRQTYPTFNASDPSDWYLETTVDAHMGYHSTGMVMREYQTIHTNAADLANHDGDLDPTEDNADWWSHVLTDIHTAAVKTAEASPEEIERAAASLDVDHTDDPAYDLMRYQSGLDLETCAKCARDVALALISTRRPITGATDD